MKIKQSLTLYVFSIGLLGYWFKFVLFKVGFTALLVIRLTTIIQLCTRVYNAKKARLQSQGWEQLLSKFHN